MNLETPLDNDGDPLTITAADAVTANEVPPWNWRTSPDAGMCLIMVKFFVANALS